MKRFYRVTVLLVLCAALLCACGKAKDNDEALKALFDEAGEEKTAAATADTETSATVEDGKEDEEKKEETPTPVAAPQPLPDAEAAVLCARYEEAQEFYDDMLMQNYPLDNMDRITVVTDAYENEAYRVLYENINSLADLAARYGAYFTSAFIDTLDFSAYTEKDGKLYCLSSGYGSNRTPGGVRYDTEQIDENHAVLLVIASYSDTSKTGTHRIPCEKIDGVWYFGGVAG